MSKDIQSPPSDNYVLGYLWSYQLSDFEGRLLTFVELLGLSQTQQEAAKSQIRQLVWSFADETYYVPRAIHDELMKSPDVVQNKYRYAPIQTGAKKKAK